MKHEAKLYEKLEDGRVHCHLCSHECRIVEGKRGLCHVRENQGSTLYTLVYGRTIAQHVDPVEKKPLLHFYPGSEAYSIATPGCNFRCDWCQNWEISQMPREQHLISGTSAQPEEIIKAAQHHRCRSIAYTYTEPTVFYEYARDIARQAHEAGLANIFVTNGYMTEAMLRDFDPYLDAANVDLKAFRDDVYRKYVGARLQPVLDSLKVMKELGIWVEVTTLIIPGINDDEAEIKDAAHFVAETLGVETPWHLSRFFPMYKMANVPRTPTETLQRALEIGKAAGLHHVYVGNLPGESNTMCHACNHLLIQRSGYTLRHNTITPDGTCPNCGTPVAGIGMST